MRGAAAPSPTPESWGQQAGRPLARCSFPLWVSPLLFQEWSGTPWGVIGCHRRHLLPLQKNKSKCNALRFLNSCRSAKTRQSAKLWEGELGLRGEGGGGGGGPRAGEGRGEGVKGTLSVGDARSSPWGASKVGDARAGRVPGVGIGARGQRVKRPLPVGETLGSLNPWVGWGARKVRPLGRVGSPEWRSRLGEGGGGRGPHPVGSAGRSATLGGLGEEGCLDWSWGCFGPPAGRSRLRAGWGAGKGEARRGGAGGSSLPAARERAPSQPSHAVRERRVVASAQTVPRRRGGFQRAPPPSNHSAAPARGMHLCGAGPRSG